MYLAAIDSLFCQAASFEEAGCPEPLVYSDFVHDSASVRHDFVEVVNRWIGGDIAA